MGIDITHRILAYDAQSNKSIIAEYDSRWKYSIAGERVDLVFKSFVSLVLPNHDSIEEYASDIEKHYLSGSEFPSRSKYSIVREGMEQSELYVHSGEEAQGCMPSCIDNVSQRYYTRATRVGMQFSITNPSFKMILEDAEQCQYSHVIEFSGFELDEMPSIVKALVNNTHLVCQCVKVLNAQPLTHSTQQYKSVTQNDGHTYLVQTAHGIVQRAYKVHSIDTVEEGGILINFETYK